MYIKEQHKKPSFAIDAHVTEETFSDLRQQGEVLFDMELELLGRSNPYLLAAIAKVANVFEEIPEEIACMQGALLVYHMVGLSLEKNHGYVPQVTEEHMLRLVEKIDPKIATLEKFISKEVSLDTQEEFLIETMHEVYTLFHFNKENLLAFGTGMVMTYDILRLAEEG